MNILITGGTGGLGQAMVNEFCAEIDNNVYFTYCHSEAKATELTAKYSNSHSLKCDFSNTEEISALQANISDMSLDVLVNNAWWGKPEGIRFNRLTSGQIEATFVNNVLPTVAITQTALETFRKKKSGKIITILTSYLVGTPPLGYSLYAATKAYIAQLAKSWSCEYIKLGITSNCVSPEFMRTDFTSETLECVVEELANANPLKRLVTPSEVANVVRMLSAASCQLNGVNIPINAGTKIL